MIEKAGGILYIKVGNHAQETLPDIIVRKKREISDAGFSMWGYGGNTCHPTTMVQPFAQTHSNPGQPILLCMQPMESKHFAEPVRAEEYSINGIDWLPVPDKINVVGSRYALFIKDLVDVDEGLVLDNTQVALGNSEGKRGSDYIQGHVDKACLEFVDDVQGGSAIVPIKLVAEIVHPYAVFLKGQVSNIASRVVSTVGANDRNSRM